MAYKHTPPRRCHWFENDGTPRPQKNGAMGCTYPSCFFIHPDDPEWSHAMKARPPELNPPRSRERHKGNSDYDTRDRDRERDKDYGQWERERPRDRDRGGERDRARSPRALSSGPSTSSASAPSPTKDPRLPSRPSTSSSALPTATSSNSIPLGSGSPKKSTSTSTLAPRDSISTSLTAVAQPRSTSLARTDTVSMGAPRARESSFSSFDRGGFRDRDKSPASATSDSRSRFNSNRLRRDSTASTTMASSPAPQTATISSIASSMPPPPVLKLGTLQPTLTISPNTTSSTSPTVTASRVHVTAATPTRQDKVQIWVDRIKQLADAVQVRTQHVELERELGQLKSLLTSRQYASLSEAAREKLEKQIKATEERHTEKRLELNDLVYKLVDSDFWDASMTWPGIDEDMVKADKKGKGKEREPRWDRQELRESSAEGRFKELRTVVWQVRDGVNDLYKIVGELRSNPGIEGQRPAKRRRMDESFTVDEPVVSIPASTSTLATQPSPSSHLLSFAKSLPTPPMDFDSIINRLTRIDDRVSDLENTMVQLDSEALNELETRMEERLQELSLGGNGSEDKMTVDGEAPDTGQEKAGERKLTIVERMRDVEREIDHAGLDISGLAVEIAEIITKAQATDDEVVKLKKENEEMKGRIAVLEKQNQENAESLKAFKAEMEALNAALQAYIARPPSPPPVLPPVPLPPTPPDLQTIVETVRPRVIQSVRENIIPMLEELKESVQAMTTKQNMQMAQNVMNKLQLTLKTVEVIYAWMNRSTTAQMPPPAVPTGPSSIPPPGQVNGINAANVATNGGPTGTTPPMNGAPTGPIPPTIGGSASQGATSIVTAGNGIPLPPVSTKALPQ